MLAAPAAKFPKMLPLWDTLLRMRSKEYARRANMKQRSHIEVKKETDLADHHCCELLAHTLLPMFDGIILPQTASQGLVRVQHGQILLLARDPAHTKRHIYRIHTLSIKLRPTFHHLVHVSSTWENPPTDSFSVAL
jgi:hypothetical protein